MQYFDPKASSTQLSPSGNLVNLDTSTKSGWIISPTKKQAFRPQKWSLLLNYGLTLDWMYTVKSDCHSDEKVFVAEYFLGEKFGSKCHAVDSWVEV
jgi:hypothetical protein